MDAVTAFDLRKQYKETVALRGLNLQVPEGALFACVGEKGCGKTTLLRLLSGLLRPDAGECAVMGCSPLTEGGKLHSLVGVSLFTSQLYAHMTLGENLRFFAGLGGVSQSDAVDRASFLMHRLEIFPWRDQPASRLPTSAARRASLARALMHYPKVLLLDELPMGMDFEGREAVRGLLTDLVRDEGITVLLCTENFFFAQNLCESFAVLRDGAIGLKGTLEGLRQSVGLKYRALLRFSENTSPPPGFFCENGFWCGEIDSEKEMPGLISQVVLTGGQIFEARLQKPTLEEIYRQYMEKGLKREDERDETRDEREAEKLPGAGIARSAEEFPAADAEPGEEVQPL